MESNLYDFVPILMQIAFCSLFVTATVIISSFLGPSRKNARKNANFECGLDPLTNSRTPFAVKYFLVAILFVLFDIEIIFMYPWAVNYQSMGLSGLLKMGGFVLILVVGYFYILKRKALTWEK